jgi:hypothetical protein
MNRPLQRFYSQKPEENGPRERPRSIWENNTELLRLQVIARSINGFSAKSMCSRSAEIPGGKPKRIKNELL